MRALVVEGPGRASVQERPDPRPGPGEQLVRVAAASVCATDRKLLARGAPEPLVPGHEFAGHLADGRAVGVHPDIGCGACAECRDGWNNRCPDRVPIGLGRDGGLAELAAVPSTQLVPLDGVPVDIAPFLEPLACSLHAVHRMGVRGGDRAVVVGAGPMGLLTTWALQRAGARVAVCQRSPRRRAAA
ncbi:zinc-dependent alcohol dehydrogenase, partial [Nocardiopsis nanhaiensis]